MLLANSKDPYITLLEKNTSPSLLLLQPTNTPLLPSPTLVTTSYYLMLLANSKDLYTTLLETNTGPSLLLLQPANTTVSASTHAYNI